MSASPLPRGPLSEAEVARLAYGHLGHHAGLSYLPDIPVGQEILARAIHGRHLLGDGPLLVVYDSTGIGTASSGFVVTPARVCWKRPWSSPHQMEWRSLRRTPVALGDGRVTIGRDALPVAGGLARGLARFLGEMASRAELRETTPYRAAAPGDHVIGLVDAVALLTWEALGAMTGLDYRPFIPAHRLARGLALARMPGADVAVLYEDGLLGTPRGFLLTGHHLATWQHDGRSSSVALRDIDAAEALPASVLIANEPLPWSLMLDGRKDLPRAMARLFLALGDRARAGTLG